jgi:hypothetical protein
VIKPTLVSAVAWLFLAAAPVALATSSVITWFGTVSADVTNSGNYSGGVPNFGGTADTNFSVLNGPANAFSYGAGQGATVFNGYLYLGWSAGSSSANTFNLTGGTVSFGAVAGSSYNQNVIALDGYGGTLNVSGGTVNFLNGNTGDNSSLWVGNGGQVGNLNVSGGTVAVQNGLILGRDSGTGIVNVSGTGVITVGGTAGTVVVNAGSLTFGTGTGIFKQTGVGTMNLGSTGTINFASSSQGTLSLLGAPQSYFDGLVSSGKILLNGAASTPAQFSYQSVGGQGTYRYNYVAPAGPPVINSALTAAGTTGSAFSYTVTATNSPTSFGASNLPPGLSFNAATGAITGAPTFAGISSVSLSAANTLGTATATLQLNVSAAASTVTYPFVHPLFTSNMVLQRNVADPIWGWTTPGTMVTVAVLDQNGATAQTAQATAGTDGRWQAVLGPFGLVPNNAAYSVVISSPGAQTVTLANVLIGDVWICSGQSNMEYTLYGNYPPNSGGTYMANSTNEINSSAVGGANYASNSFIRHFKISRGTTATTPQSIFVGGVDSGGWTLAASNSSAFTAVGYFMARQIYLSQNVPVGLINSTWGGTDITPWLPAPSIRLIADYTNAIDSGAETQGYYNAMLAPVAGYPIKGFAWYQGESSTGLGGPLYGALLAKLRDGMRAEFSQPNLPFIAVQLCTNGGVQTVPVEPSSSSSYAEIREAEVNTALADAYSRAVVTVDCTYIDPGTGVSGGTYNANVHPINKQDMGLRAGQAALNVAYGQSTQYLSPTFDHASASGNTIRCYFDNVGNGLMVGLQPQNLTAGAAPSPGPILQQTAGTLTGFAVAGANGTYYAATAVIDPATNTVVVSSSSVPAPLYVRYGWGNNPWNETALSYPTAPSPNPGVPLCNLYRMITDGNGNVIDGVPVSPFRNDPVAQLSVNAGAGTGTYSPGQTVGVTANAAPAGESFACWSGDTDLLANPNSPSTTATLARTYVSLLANYNLNTAPTGLSGYAYSLQVGLTWNSVANATTYSVKRAPASGGPFTVIATGLTATSYADTTAGFGSPWYYVVTASNAAGESPSSAVVSVTPLAPGAPTGVTATAGDTTVDLTWGAANTGTAYNINRATASGGPFTTIVTGVTGLSYVDASLTDGTTYYYTVTTTYGGVAGPSSAAVSAVPVASSTLVRRSVNGTSAASSVGNSAQTDVQAFDQNISTKWITNATATGWLQYQFGNGSAWTVIQYQITSANDVPARDPMNWQILGSNDGSRWAVLDTRAGQVFSSRNLTETYNSTNPSAYRFYRLNVTANSGDTYLQLAEFALFSSASDHGLKTPPVLAVPANITTAATGAAGAPVNYTVTATDAATGAPLSPVCNPAAGTVFPIGATLVQCAATDPAGNTGTGSFTVTVQPSFASYLAAYFTAAQLSDPSETGPLADPDGDGRSNLLEYFEGTNPNAADSDGVSAAPDGQGNLILNFRMAKNIFGVSYGVQSSSDLLNWGMAAGVTYQTVADKGSYYLMQATVPVGTATSTFLRLSISQP